MRPSGLLWRAVAACEPSFGCTPKGAAAAATFAALNVRPQCRAAAAVRVGPSLQTLCCLHMHAQERFGCKFDELKDPQDRMSVGGAVGGKKVGGRPGGWLGWEAPHTPCRTCVWRCLVVCASLCTVPRSLIA